MAKAEQKQDEKRASSGIQSHTATRPGRLRSASASRLPGTPHGSETQTSGVWNPIENVAETI